MTTVDTSGSSAGSGSPPPKKHTGALDRSDSRAAWFFILPAGILLVLFIVIPFGLAIVFSFTNQRLISPLATRFVGIENYIDQLTDATFWKSLWNNARFSIFVVPFQTALALGLAESSSMAADRS